jgi:hypothetical protein
MSSVLQPVFSPVRYIVVDMQMDSGTHIKKRALSATERTSSPGLKRMKKFSQKPVLRLDCTRSPRLQPQPIQYSSPLPFSIDSSATFTSSVHSVHSAARSYHNPFSNKLYDCQQPYNYEPQSYQPAQCKPPTPLHWKGFSGFQPAWTPTRMPYGADCKFVGMCQTGVSRSIYSGFSNNSGHLDDFPSAVSKNIPVVLPKKTGDGRDTFINALVSCLLEVKETLAAQQGSIEKLLQMVKLALLDDQQWDEQVKLQRA